MKFIVSNIGSRRAAVAYIEQLPDGKPFEVSITRKRERRTLDQNRLYWLWLGAISAECGHTPDELHAYFKAKYLARKSVAVFGEQAVLDVTTRDLTKEQMTAYLERVQAFAASELAIPLPNPEDVYFGQFYEQYKHFI